MQAYTLYMPLYLPFPPALLLAFIPLILAVVLWIIIIKGYALWYAARAGQKWWFIALLICNTLGILEIIYLIWFRPKTDLYDTAPVHTSSSAQ